MTAVSEIESEHGVADFERRQVDRLVGLRARVGLHVGGFGTEEFFRAVAGNVLDHVDMFATAVVATTRITFGVLVGQDATGGFHDGDAGVVFAGDHLKAILLTNSFGVDQVINFRVLAL